MDTEYAMSDTKEARERKFLGTVPIILCDPCAEHHSEHCDSPFTCRDIEAIRQAAYSAGLASAAQPSENEEAEFEKWLGEDAQADFADGAMQAWAEQEKRKRRALASAADRERELREENERLRREYLLMEQGHARALIEIQNLTRALRGEKKL